MIPKGIKVTAVIFFTIFVLGGCEKFEHQLFDWGLSVERSRSGLVFRTMRSDGWTITYLERKGPGDTIVLLHGFGANKDTWIRFVRYMPKAYHILAVDMSGHGDSNRNMNLSYDVQHLTAAFCGTVESLGLHRFHLAGNSLGGYIATFYAVQNPQKLISLGLFASAGVWPPEPSDLQIALAKGDNPLLIDSPESFDRLMNFVFYQKPRAPWPVRSVLVHDLAKQHDFYQKIWNDIWDARKDVRALLPEIQIPVLLLWGDKDRILHVSSVKVYQRYLPHVQTRIIKECGHGLIIEKPQEAAHAYAQFLQNMKASNDDAR